MFLREFCYSLFSISRSELASRWDFNDQDLLTPPRGVLFLRTLLKF
jgi:hypothetical protein